MGRGTSWGQHEDVQRATSWLEVSEDSIKGRNMKGAGFERLLYYHFRTNKSTETTRDQGVVLGSWTTIQSSVRDFCGF
jgi:hypothetical protein